MQFAVEDIRVINDEVDKSQFALLSVDAFATGVSAHDTFITEETLKKTAPTILQKPFVFAIDKRFDDLGTHQNDEVAGGFVPANSPLLFKTLDDGRTMLNCQVLIWKRYSQNLVDYFARDGGKKGVSVEIEVLDSKQDAKTGLLELLDFTYNAITGLGDLVTSAIPNAQAVLQFSKQFEHDKEEYLQFSRYEDVDMTIPMAVKTAAKKALDSYDATKDYMSPASLAMARFLVKNDNVTPERIRAIKRFFTKKTFDDSNETLMGLYGGSASKNWYAELCDALDELDDKKLQYFDSGEIKQEKPMESDVVSNSNKDTSDKMALEESKNETSTTMSYEKDNYNGMEEMNMAEDKKKPAEGSAEEEKQETPQEEKAEQEKGKGDAGDAKKKFSLDGYVDVMAALGFLKNTTDVNEEMAAKMRMASDAMEQYASDADAGDDDDLDFAGKVMSGMYAAMCGMSAKIEKMAADNETYMAKMADLEKFKADMEDKQKQFAIDSSLKELDEKVVIPADVMTAMREKAQNFSLANIEAWKNDCKATVFDFAVKGKLEDDGIIRYGMHTLYAEVKPVDDVWANLGVK